MNMIQRLAPTPIRTVHSTTKIDGKMYSIDWDNYQQHYIVTDSEGNTVVNLTNRKINTVKRDLREWLQN